MPENCRRKYLVIAEIERKGFIAGCCKKYWSAVKLANELLLLGELFPWTESERIKIQLQSKQFREYRIKGNQIYFDKGIYGSADGKYSVTVLPVNKKKSDLEIFIKERENYSIVFSSEQHANKRFREYFNNFPPSLHKAN